MLDPRIADDVTRHLRAGLAERDDVGRFLLGEIDRALAAGVEDIQDEYVDSARGKSRRSGKKVVIRRAPTPEEVLLTHVRVLKSYLVEADLAAESALRDLGEFAPVEGIVVSFRSDFETEDYGSDEEKELRLGSGRLTHVRNAAETQLSKLETMILGASEEK